MGKYQEALGNPPRCISFSSTSHPADRQEWRTFKMGRTRRLNPTRFHIPFTVLIAHDSTRTRKKRIKKITIPASTQMGNVLHKKGNAV